MACQTLLRRKTQLALLAGACEQGAAARIGLRRRAAATGEARLVALERDGVLVRWTGDRVRQAEVPGQPVEVRFEHAGEQYGFFASARGCVGRRLEHDKRHELLKLSLPLRLEQGRRRAQARLAFEGRPPLTATFTHVVDDRRQFQAQLTDIADGGVGVVARADDVSRLHTGDLFWMDIDLPGETSCPEFVVRLTHLRPVKNTDTLAMGWAFQPADDAAHYEKSLRRLEAFAARQPLPARTEGAG